jgi:MoaA/NifB/PqqE/SkfB family radical SAM enzyme
MLSVLRQAVDTIKLLPLGGPGVCNMAITNVCNAKCDFCNYARDKMFVQDRVWVDYDQYCQALDILYDRGIRYLTLVGGEPTMHPHIRDMIRYGVKIGMRPTMVTNGSRLTPELVRGFKDCGLKTLFVSIDAATVVAHEENRGLPGVCDRVRAANAECKGFKIKTIASVTVNKLIDDFPSLLGFLKDLGFETVNFAYPKRGLNSPALSYSATSQLIDYSVNELICALDEIKSLKDEYAILNSRESLEEIKRFVRKDKQLYPCVGGNRYFYVDYHLDIYRCDFWETKMCSVFEFCDQPFVKDHSTQCISGCYRDASVLMHPAIAVSDTLQDLRQGKFRKAMDHLSKSTNFRAIKTMLQDWKTIGGMAKTHTSLTKG